MLMTLTDPASWPLPEWHLPGDDRPDVRAANEAQWGNACAVLGPNLLGVLQETGMSLIGIDPENPGRYFQLEAPIHLNLGTGAENQCTLAANEIGKEKQIRGLTQYRRWESIREVVQEMESDFPDPDSRQMVFYSCVQGRLKSKPASASSNAGSELMFGFTCDLLRQRGFTFSMD